MKYTIFAPHIDDEAIGCYSLFIKKNIKVVYFSEITKERKKEAINAGKTFGFKISYAGYAYKPTKDEVLVVPCKEDTHPEHRQVNAFAKDFNNKKLYYSTDKNIAKILLPETTRAAKKVLMDRVYPSQKKLWENDEKYILFEGIREFDYIIYAKATYQFPYIHSWNNAKNYLKYPHRHLFYISLMIEQFHDDRDIEFIKLKEELSDFCQKTFTSKTNLSCEMMGGMIREYFDKKFKYSRRATVQVMEDNENGMIIV